MCFQFGLSGDGCLLVVSFEKMRVVGGMLTPPERKIASGGDCIPWSKPTETLLLAAKYPNGAAEPQGGTWPLWSFLFLS